MGYLNFTTLEKPTASETSAVISSLYSAYAFLKSHSFYTDEIIQSFYDLYDQTTFYPICQVIYILQVNVLYVDIFVILFLRN